MPCDMGGYQYSGPSWKEQEKEKQWRRRIAFLEEALCGLCQQMSDANFELHPQLQAWFDDHKSKPGCVAK